MSLVNTAKFGSPERSRSARRLFDVRPYVSACFPKTSILFLIGFLNGCCTRYTGRLFVLEMSGGTGGDLVSD